MKKKIVCALTLVGLASSLFALNSFATMNPNSGDATDKIRVIIGQNDSGVAGLMDAENIVLADSLETLSQTDTIIEVPALVAFNDFLTVDEVAGLLESIENVKTVYIWMPHKTGRCIIDVVDNDLSRTIASYFDTLDIEGITDLSFKNDMMELVSNYGIFAVELSGSYDELNRLTDNNAVARVDLIQSAEAVALATETNASVSYICIPQKPDGTK